MLDTGVHLFFGGECYYRQIDALAMSLCVAKNLHDEGWEEYVLSGYQITKKYGMPPKVSMAMFTEPATSMASVTSHRVHLSKRRRAGPASG